MATAATEESSDLVAPAMASVAAAEGVAAATEYSSDSAASAMAPVAAAALQSVLSRVQQAAAWSGCAPESVCVVAVSKRKPVGVIRGVYDAGHRCFGKNYIQELIDKDPQVVALHCPIAAARCTSRSSTAPCSSAVGRL